MDKNVLLFQRSLFEEEEEEEGSAFCSTTNASAKRHGPTQPTNQREEERARAREREKRETTSFAVLVLPRFRKERKKASLSRDQITTTFRVVFRLRNVGNISRDPVQKS